MAKSTELSSLVSGTAKDAEQLLPTAVGREVHDRARSNILRRFFSPRCSWGLLATVLWLVAAVLYLLHVLPFGGGAIASSEDNAGGATFRFTFASEAHAGPVTGRLLVCIAKRSAVEDPQGEDQPRFLVDDSADTQQVFAVDVYDFYPDSQSREINASLARGYPVLLLEDIPNDEYWVQGVLHPYVHYNRSDAQQLWLPGMSTFESGGGVLTAPGTLFSKPQLMQFSSEPSFSLDIAIDQVTPPDEPLEETEELLKHIEFRSPMLSEFWGVDVFLKAWVLLPHAFFDNATQHIKYPLFVYHTHYNPDFEFDFRSQKPDDDEGAENKTSGKHTRVSDWYGYYLYNNWTSSSSEGAFTNKRGIIVQLQHANPYYDDSYAVNSANIGPYGDAITYEFLPYIEQQFRGIGEGWARTMYGGSTGGWESFAVQVFYPDEYNGCWSFCPDAFDFRKFQIVNLLEDPNAYYVRGDWTVKDRGASRNYLGQIRETMEEENHHEMVLGSRGRSGGQWDAWQAVYSPLNATDGHPTEIWDKLTGEVNHETVTYWEEHYDVRVKLQREWNAQGLGAKLVNKLHVYVGVTDSYYLNDAVYYLEDFLKTTQNPYYNGSIEYGVRDGKGYEHCWTGSFDQSLSMAWNTLNQRIVPQMVDHIVASAPPGADLSFTTY